MTPVCVCVCACASPCILVCNPFILTFAVLSGDRKEAAENKRLALDGPLYNTEPAPHNWCVHICLYVSVVIVILLILYIYQYYDKITNTEAVAEQWLFNGCFFSLSF